MTNKLTVRKLVNTNFPELYSKYMICGKLDLPDLEKLLSVAVYILNSENRILQQLGYRIIVDYCNNSSNYRPLYEIANAYGLYPVSKFIEDHHIPENEKNFFSAWNDSSVEQYHCESIYQTEEQKDLDDFYVLKEKENLSLIHI